MIVDIDRFSLILFDFAEGFGGNVKRKDEWKVHIDIWEDVVVYFILSERRTKIFKDSAFKMLFIGSQVVLQNSI